MHCKVWSQIDFQKLQDAVQKHGKDWYLISKLYFPDRKPNCIKCKYNYYLRTQAKNTTVKVKGPIGFMGYKMQLAEQFKYLQNKIADQLENKKQV